MHSVVNTVAKKVFPDGAELRTNGKATGSGSRYWMIPGKEGEPRWILPDVYKYASPFLRQWTPYNFLSRIKWKLLQAAYRSNSLGLIPGVIPLEINIPEKSNWEHLGWSQARPPVPVIYIGHPQRHNRKAVLGLIDFQNSEVISIGKVPLVSSAGFAINQEIDNLDILAKEKPGRAPRPLFVDRQNGIATQEFFNGDPTGRILTQHHLNFLISLGIPGETLSLYEELEGLERRIEKLDSLDPRTRKILERILVNDKDKMALPAVWEHGDFAPWNLIEGTNGSLRAIDWETALRRGLPLSDLVHFYSIQAFQFGEKKLFPKSMGGKLNKYLEEMNIPLGMTNKIVRTCLARDWLRRYEEGDQQLADFLLKKLVDFGDLK